MKTQGEKTTTQEYKTQISMIFPKNSKDQHFLQFFHIVMHKLFQRAHLESESKNTRHQDKHLKMKNTANAWIS